MSGMSGIVYNSTFNNDFSANKLRHTYVKGYVDISGGDLNLQNGAFTMYNGKTSGAYFSIQNDGKIWINSFGQFMSISLENLKLLKDISIEGPSLGDLQIWTQGIRHDTTMAYDATDATEINRGGLTIKGTRFKSDTYAVFLSDVSINGNLNVNNDVSFNSRLFVGRDVSLGQKLFVKNFVSIGKSLPLMSLDISYADGIRLPTGTTNERPIKIGGETGFQTQTGTNISLEDKSLYLGTIRYNTTNSQFEGFGPGNSWGSLGGVINVAQNTKIVASSPYADSTNNELMFFTAPNDSLATDDAKERMRILANGDVSINSNLFVGHDVSLGKRLYLVSDASFNSNLFVGRDVSFGQKLFVKNFVSIGKSLPLMSLDISYADGIRLPTGTTNERPIKIGGVTGFQTQTGTSISPEDKSLYVGTVRYNTTNSQFEGFGPGNSWGSLGGVINVAQNTKIVASSPYADSTNNELMFFTAPTNSTTTNAATERMRILANGDVSMNNKLSVSGDVSFNSNLTVAGNVKIENTLTFKKLTLTQGGSSSSPIQITPTYSLVEIGGTSSSTCYYSLSNGFFDGQTIKIVSIDFDSSTYSLRVSGTIHLDSLNNICSPVVFKTTCQSFDAVWINNAWIVTAYTGVNFTGSNIMFGTSGTGDIQLNAASKLHVNSHATITGNLTVTGATTFNNSVGVSGANTFTVGTGATTLGGSLAVTGATILGGTLAVTGSGATTLGGSLTVTGVTTFNNNVNVSSANTLTVGTGATTLGGTLAVTGATTFNNNVTVAANKTLNVIGSTTFTNLPTCSATPSSNTQLTTKAYVDSVVSTATTGGSTLTGLTVNGDSRVTGRSYIGIDNQRAGGTIGGGGDTAYLEYVYVGGTETTTLRLVTMDNSDDHINLNPFGNVGIKTDTPDTTLHVNGDVKANSYNAVSDYREKENVMILDASFNVDVLKPVTYNLKSSGKQDIGFIAHEVQEFYPFLVSGEKDGKKTQSLNYNGLIGILTKEIKDLKKEMRIVRLELEAESKANTKLNDDFTKLASELSVLKEIVQDLMPL